MAAGIVLIIVGAVFTFALKAESSWLDTRALGLILILGGVAFIWRSQVRKRHIVTRETQSADGAVHSETTDVVERHVE